VLDAEIVYDPSWDNAIGLLVQKTMYHDQVRGLHKFSFPDDVQLVEPTGFYRGPNGVMRAMIDRNRAICQQLHCAVLPWVVSRNDPTLTPEAMRRFRALEALFHHVSVKEDEYADFSMLIHNTPSNDISEEERGFTQGITNLDFAFSRPAFDLDEFLDATRSIPALILLSMALPVLYGAIHLATWTFEFPTPQERLLWRVASIGIAATLPALFSSGLLVWVLLLVVNTIYRSCGGTKRQARQNWKVGIKIYSGLGVTAVVFYAIARIFLVVESFIGLRRVPIGVYWTPPWLQMIPHF